MPIENATHIDDLSALKRNFDCFGGAEEQHSQKASILLVEDEDFVRRVTCEVLHCAGYIVFSARNATEALGIYEERSQSLALLMTDIVLPGENGFALAKKMRQRNSRLKVLFVTGYSEQIAFGGAECPEFLPKPFRTTVLLQRVAQLLHASEPVRAQIEENRERLFRRVCGNA